MKRFRLRPYTTELSGSFERAVNSSNKDRRDFMCFITEMEILHDKRNQTIKKTDQNIKAQTCRFYHERNYGCFFEYEQCCGICTVLTGRAGNTGAAGNTVGAGNTGGAVACTDCIKGNVEQ